MSSAASVLPCVEAALKDLWAGGDWRCVNFSTFFLSVDEIGWISFW